MQPSYAQDMGVEGVTHGFYGSMMQCLGSCVGFCGAVPCCPLPNPFKEVRQGQFSQIDSLPFIAFCSFVPSLIGLFSQGLWDSSHALASSTRRSTQAWSKSTFAVNRFASSTLKSKSSQLVGKPSSLATMSTSKCTCFFFSSFLASCFRLQHPSHLFFFFFLFYISPLLIVVQ